MKKAQQDIQIINLSKRLTLSQELDEQPELIQDLIIIFSLVGVRCFDLSPKKEIVEAANIAIKEAQSLSKTLGLEFVEPIFNVSVGRINPFLGDWSDHLNELDPFRDGRGGDRIGIYMRWLQEGFEKGLRRDKTIARANKLYAEDWGKEMVYLSEKTTQP